MATISLPLPRGQHPAFEIGQNIFHNVTCTVSQQRKPGLFHYLCELYKFCKLYFIPILNCLVLVAKVSLVSYELCYENSKSKKVVKFSLHIALLEDSDSLAALTGLAFFVGP